LQQISDRELANVTEQLGNQFKDNDRFRIIQRLITSNTYTFSCAQLKELVSVQRFGPPAVKTAILIYESKLLTDPQNFLSEVVEAFTYAEDKQEIKTALKL